VIRSSWQQRAPAGEKEQEVTQLAAHSISDGNQSSALHHGPCEDLCEEGVGAVAQSLSQFWQAGDAIGSVRTTAGLPISMAEFTSRCSVTVLRIGFNPTRSTSPCYNPTHSYNIHWHTKYKNWRTESKVDPRSTPPGQISPFRNPPLIDRRLLCDCDRAAFNNSERFIGKC